MKKEDPNNSLLIAIVEEAEKTDAEKSVVSIFDVNERVNEVKKEMKQLGSLKK